MSTGQLGALRGELKLPADPLLDVSGSVAEVPPDPEAWWALAAIAPGVDGGEGDFEVVGEFLSCEQRLKLRHPAIVADNPFILLSIRP